MKIRSSPTVESIVVRGTVCNMNGENEKGLRAWILCLPQYLLKDFEPLPDDVTPRTLLMHQLTRRRLRPRNSHVFFPFRKRP